jgi:hypothetical protein
MQKRGCKKFLSELERFYLFQYFLFYNCKIVFRNLWPLYTLLCITITPIIAIKTLCVGIMFLTELVGLRLFDDLFLTASNLPSYTCITRIEYVVGCSPRI